MREQVTGLSTDSVPSQASGRWRVMRIGDAGSLRLGRQRAPQYDFGSNMCPYLRVMNIADGRVDARDLNWMHFSRSDFDRHRLIPGDVLITEGDLASAMNVGRSAVFRGEVPDCCIQNSLIRFRLNGPGDPSFFHFAFEHLRKHGRFAHATMSTTVFHLSAGRLAAIPIAVPDEPEQRQIAAILDTIDDAIRKTEQIIAKLKLVKRGLLHDLLTRGIDDNGELRDPERHPEQFKDSPLGRIPRGWEVSQLGSFLDAIQQGWSPDCASTPTREGQWGVLKTTAVQWGGFSSDANKALPRSLPPRPHIEVHRGDVLMTRAGPASRVGVVAFVQRTQSKLMLSDKLYRLVPSGALNAQFLTLALSGEVSQRHLSSMKAGLAETQENISHAIVRALRFVRPPLEEQTLISAQVVGCDERETVEVRQLEKLRLAKAGLMEDLLTGRVRVTKLLENAAE